MFERQRDGTENPVLVEWNHQMGVPRVYRDIWGPHVDLSRDGTDASAGETDDESTVVSAHDDDEHAEHGVQEVEPRRAGKPHDSHARDISAEHDQPTLTDPLLALTPLPPPASMTTKPRTWISLWCVHKYRTNSYAC